MEIRETALPLEIESAMPSYLRDVEEYLELEEAGFEPRDVRYSRHLVVDDVIGFVIFDYAADESPDDQDDLGPSFAFLQYDFKSGVDQSSCYACWPRTKGRSLEWSIEEYLRTNPS